MVGKKKRKKKSQTRIFSTELFGKSWAWKYDVARFFWVSRTPIAGEQTGERRMTSYEQEL